MSRARKSTFSLSWKELAEADDFLTLNLLDNTYYWVKSRKVLGTPPSDLEIPKAIVLKLLRRYVIDALKPQTHKCVCLLMAHPTTKRFLSRYDGDEAKTAGFALLCRRYVESYIPDCRFEVNATDRFGKFYGLEGCVVARKVIEAGAEIKYLTGSLAPLTRDEEDELKTELSILTISSLKETCLMLGPCRFINHNCEANAKLEKSINGIMISAKKKILPGEEITVEYASNYFGKRNRNCLCAACERKEIGFYHPERQKLNEHLVGDLSDSEDEVINTLNVTQPIVLESAEVKDEKSPSPIDTEEPEVNPARVKKVESLNEESQRLPRSGLECLKMAMVYDAVLPSSEDNKVVGGRTLRKRENSRVALSYDATILQHYPLDDSLDTLDLLENPLDRDLNMQRQTMRTLHKLYMLDLYKGDADLSQIYDCLNCGVYFQLLDTHPFKEYCPRCVRHYQLFKLAWPDTIVVDSQNTKALELNATRRRCSIKSSISKRSKLMKQIKEGSVEIKQIVKAQPAKTLSPKTPDHKEKTAKKKITKDTSDDSQKSSQPRPDKTRQSRAPVRTKKGSKKRVAKSQSPTRGTKSVKRAKTTTKFTSSTTLVNPYGHALFTLAHIRCADNIMSNDPLNPLEVSDSSDDDGDDSTKLLVAEKVRPKENTSHSTPNVNPKKPQEHAKGVKSSSRRRLILTMSSHNSDGSPVTNSKAPLIPKKAPESISTTSKTSASSTTTKKQPKNGHASTPSSSNKDLNDLPLKKSRKKALPPMETKETPPLNQKETTSLQRRKKKKNRAPSIREPSDGLLEDWQSEIMRLEKANKRAPLDEIPKRPTAQKLDKVKTRPSGKSSIAVSSVKAQLDGSTQTSANSSPRLSTSKTVTKHSPRKDAPLPKARLTSELENGSIPSRLPVNRKPLSLPKKEAQINYLMTELSGATAVTAIAIDDNETVVIENGREIVLLDDYDS